MRNSTAHPGLGHPQSEARKWFEPLLVVSIMLFSLYINRYRSFDLFPNRSTPSRSTSTDNLLPHSSEVSDEEDLDSAEGKVNATSDDNNKHLYISLPDTSRFASNPHSRLLQKLPFLIEMFYWALNYLAYALTKRCATRLYGSQDPREITQLAQAHGIDILTLEHDTFFSCVFPIPEVQLQQFFLRSPALMTLFNRAYSLVHIPGTVAFLSWWYYAAPDFATFAKVRRTMVLGNFFAFAIFTFYPCMPPRLLPKSFGFHDTVRQGHAESVWTGGGNVNELAAMPSLHFTYAAIVGCTFGYHSGALDKLFGWQKAQDSKPKALAAAAYAIAAVLYPVLVLLIIVATANHYYLDAVVATFSVSLALACNRVWLVLRPLEVLLQWVLRVEKPVPSTGLWREEMRMNTRRRGRVEVYA